MTKQQKIDSLKSAYTAKEKGDDTIYIISDTTTEETTDKLIDIQGSLNASFDLSYEIVAKACDLIAENSDAELNNGVDGIDPAEVADGSCSLYTAVRLSYLTNTNESEIYDIIKEYSTTDISTACAIWYENKVSEALQSLIEWINE